MGRRLPKASVVVVKAARLRADVPLCVLDALFTLGAYGGMLVLRFDGSVPPSYWSRIRVFLPLAVCVHLAANWVWRLYGQVWRHASVAEARRVALAGASAAVLLLTLSAASVRMPISVMVLGLTVATVLMGAVRFQARLFAVHRRVTASATQRVAVIGGGQAGATLIRQMLQSPQAGFFPVAVLDDDERKHGRSIAGIPVVGRVEELTGLVERLKIDQAVLAVPSARSSLIARAAAAAEAGGIGIKVLPTVADLVRCRVSLLDIRDLKIEDLLGRKQIVTDLVAVRGVLQGRCVLITGAGGSIGSEIARQVEIFKPHTLVLLDCDETHLYDAAQALESPAIQVLADIRDLFEMDRIFDQYRPDVVFHAAALKHVPLLESHPCQAATTNVLGTQNIVECANRFKVSRLVFISTDKAVHPSSIMGATKRLGEQIVLGNAPTGGHFCAVRFGNVIGSRGSVTPTFARQILAGGPVTVTDPRMTRFFMSISEAVQLVLQASAFSDGELFMLDMGEPVNILDLAERMIRMSGREVGVDVPIQVTGRRPGEKLAEELRSPEEVAVPTAHPAILRVKPIPLARRDLHDGLQRLSIAASLHDESETAAALWRLTPDGGIPESTEVGQYQAACTIGGAVAWTQQAM